MENNDRPTSIADLERLKKKDAAYKASIKAITPSKGGDKPGKLYEWQVRVAGMIWRLGGYDRDVAEALGVHISQVRAWTKEFPAMAEASKASEFAIQRMEKAAFQRGIGYTKQVGDKKVHVPGHPDSQRFWLTNRAQERWKNRLEHKHDVDVKVTLEQRSVVMNLIGIAEANPTIKPVLREMLLEVLDRIDNAEPRKPKKVALDHEEG